MHVACSKKNILNVLFQKISIHPMEGFYFEPSPLQKFSLMFTFLLKKLCFFEIPLFLWEAWWPDVYCAWPELELA